LWMTKTNKNMREATNVWKLRVYSIASIKAL